MQSPQETNSATPSPAPTTAPGGASMPVIQAAVRRFSVARAIGRVLRAIGLLLLGTVLLLLMLWCVAAIYYTDLSSSPPRSVPAGIFVVAALAAVIFIRPKRRYLVGVLLLMFAGVLAWYFSRPPSNDRDWAPEVARLASAETSGSRVTVRNVRNFDYRSETDFTEAWEDRTYDLDRVRTVDLILVHWGSDRIAHVIAAFGFDDGQYLDVSIETRKEGFESYSAIQGFFRQYELCYVFADERDVLRLRTNFRKEDVYVFRTRATPDVVRKILVSYLEKANALRDRPEWYNALTTNCSTSVLPHLRAAGRPGTWSLDVLSGGYVARQAYRVGMLADDLPFDELEKRSYVNPTAVSAGNGPDFSHRIRANLPDPRAK
jgi:hypothetical protein